MHEALRYRKRRAGKSRRAAVFFIKFPLFREYDLILEFDGFKTPSISISDPMKRWKGSLILK